jgi:c-di-GMP-binding flagellar brake protein YcgR
MVFKKEEIPLSLGQRVTLKVRNEVFNVQVRGWCTGQYIILDLPKIGADYFRVAPQTGLQIHFTKEGVFVNFKSTSILTFVQAISLLIIEYPRNVDTHNLRKYARFKANLAVSYFSENDVKKKVDAGIIRDISSGGILFTHTRQIGKEDLLKITFEVPNGGKIQQQLAEVRNIRKNPKSETSPFVTGIKWRNLQSEVELVIKNFVQMRSSERRNDSR